MVIIDIKVVLFKLGFLCRGLFLYKNSKIILPQYESPANLRNTKYGNTKLYIFYICDPPSYLSHMKTGVERHVTEIVLFITGF